MERKGASHVLTAAPELQVQMLSTRGKSVQNLTFQPLVKWQNKGQIYNLCIEMSLRVYSIRDSKPESLSGSASIYMPIVQSHLKP